MVVWDAYAYLVHCMQGNRQSSEQNGALPVQNANDPSGGQDEIQAQIARFQEQVDVLMKDRRPSDAVDDASRTETAVCGAIKAARQQIKELLDHIRSQPLLAVLIAAAVDFVLRRAR